MGRRAKAARYKFDEEDFKLPRLEELSLTELKNIGRTLGLHVTKYNNREKIVNDLYPIINGMRVNEHIPARSKRYERVTEATLLPEYRYEILSYEGKGAITGGISVKGIFHRYGRDGYVSRDLLPGSEDVLVIETVIKKYDLTEGDYIVGRYMYYDKADLYALIDIISINGSKPGASPSSLPSVAAPEAPFSLWNEKSALLRALDAVCSPCVGESLLITHPAAMRSPELLLDASETFKLLYPDAEVIALYLMPPVSWSDTLRASGAEVVDSLVPAGFAYEAVEVACARCQKLAQTGHKVLLVVYNLHYPAQTGDLQILSRVLNAAALYSNGGSVTVFAGVNREALRPEGLGFLLGFADCRLVLTQDEQGFLPDLGASGTAREPNEALLEIRRQAGTQGDRAVFEQITRL